MPNWSDTTIKMTGKKELIEKIYENVNKYGLDWGPVKMPAILRAYSSPAEIVERDEWLKYAKEYRGKKEEYGLHKMKKSVADRLFNKYKFWNSNIGALTPDWYNWRVANWGTKWNIEPSDMFVDIGHINDSKASIYMGFMSAWSGPDEWFKTMCEKYNLSGEYVDSETGCDFFHKIEYKDGKEESEIQTGYISEASIEFYGLEHFLDNVYYEVSDEETLENALAELELIKRYCRDKADIELINERAKEIKEEFEESKEGE
jgi:hypothetical protein